MKPLLFLFTLLAGLTASAADGGFLFVTFKGEQTPMSEQIYFALSRDGRDWEALNGGAPVLVSDVGEKGVRDPFILRLPNGREFCIIATDLSIHLNHDWGRAVTAGSKSIVIWKSADLVHWTGPNLVKVAADDAGCTWAPEAVYDEQARDYLVFWASKNKRDDFKKHRIWAARTRDFVTFSKPSIYIDNPNDVIDTDIARENGKYYRFSKDEKFKAITMEVSDRLTGPWKEVQGFSLAKMTGYEGPCCYQLAPAAAGKPAQWCLLLDFYSRGQGYKPFVCDDLSGGKFTPAADIHFPFPFRHGTVMPVTAEEYQRLKETYGQQ
jgi:hypothetical protein